MHFLPIRVYYDDTDAGGIVHHANYLKFFERGRTESLRELGFELVSLFSKDDAQFVIHSVQLDFLQPARLDQLLYVATQVIEVKKASILYNQAIHCETKTGPMLCRGKVKLACLSREGQLRRLPEKLFSKIQETFEIQMRFKNDDETNTETQGD